MNITRSIALCFGTLTIALLAGCGPSDNTTEKSAVEGMARSNPLRSVETDLQVEPQNSAQAKVQADEIRKRIEVRREQLRKRAAEHKKEHSSE